MITGPSLLDKPWSFAATLFNDLQRLYPEQTFRVNVRDTGLGQVAVELYADWYKNRPEPSQLDLDMAEVCIKILVIAMTEIPQGHWFASGKVESWHAGAPVNITFSRGTNDTFKYKHLPKPRVPRFGSKYLTVEKAYGMLSKWFADNRDRIRKAAGL